MATSRDQIDRRVRVLGEPVDTYPERAPEGDRGSALRVTVAGEEILHRPLKPVTDEEFGSEELSRLIDDMFATMYVADGVGLAANQVDVDLRLFVYDCTDEDGRRHVGHLCNPVVEELPVARRHLDVDEEGCLSVPGPYMQVARPDYALVHATDQHGKPVTVDGRGFFARCLQHETDHLNGYLYIDRLSKRDRKEALKQMDAKRDEVFARRAAKAETLGK